MGSPTLDPLRGAGIPIYGDVRSAAFVLSRLVERGDAGLTRVLR